MADGRAATPTFTLHPTERFVFQSMVDCNMAEAWVGDTFRIFPGKTGEDPLWGEARDLKIGDGADADEAFLLPAESFVQALIPANVPAGTPGLHGAVWFETVYQDVTDASGRRLYALYHNENYPETLPYDEATGAGYRDDNWPPGLGGDGSRQAVCRIGIMRSDDGGLSWADHGIILEDLMPRMIVSPINRNNTFPGGVGDPSAVASGDHLYVFYGEYGYPGVYDEATHDAAVEASAQCISVARIPLSDLDSPSGAARRWDGSSFSADPAGIGVPVRSLQIPPEKGGGPVSAGDKRFHWGPSVSWNTHLECWVMVMCRVDAGYWVGDSLFISYNPHRDLGESDNSQDWSTPELLYQRPGRTLWYPALQPLATPEDVAERRTCMLVDKRARLFFKASNSEESIYLSDFIIEFDRPADASG